MKLRRAYYVPIHMLGVGAQFISTLAIRKYLGLDAVAEFILLLSSALTLGAVLDFGAISSAQWQLISNTRAANRTQPRQRERYANILGIWFVIAFILFQMQILHWEILAVSSCVISGAALAVRRAYSSLYEALGQIELAKLLQLAFPVTLLTLTAAMIVLRIRQGVPVLIPISALISGLTVIYVLKDRRSLTRVGMLNLSMVKETMGLWSGVSIASAMQSTMLFTLIAGRFDSFSVYWLFISFRINSIISDLVSSQLRARLSNPSYREITFLGASTRAILPSSLVGLLSVLPVVYFSRNNEYLALLFLFVFFFEYYVTFVGFQMLANGITVPYAGLISKSLIIVGLVYLAPRQFGIEVIGFATLGANCIYFMVLMRKYPIAPVMPAGGRRYE